MTFFPLTNQLFNKNSFKGSYKLPTLGYGIYSIILCKILSTFNPVLALILLMFYMCSYAFIYFYIKSISHIISILFMTGITYSFYRFANS
jgi:hypothetical protein